MSAAAGHQVSAVLLRGAEAEGPSARPWSAVGRHRHDVSTSVVERGADGLWWTGRAHDTRWLPGSEPLLHTLGEHEIAPAADRTATALVVSRSWTRPAD